MASQGTCRAWQVQNLPELAAEPPEPAAEPRPVTAAVRGGLRQDTAYVPRAYAPASVPRACRVHEGQVRPEEPPAAAAVAHSVKDDPWQDCAHRSPAVLAAVVGACGTFRGAQRTQGDQTASPAAVHRDTAAVMAPLRAPRPKGASCPAAPSALAFARALAGCHGAGATEIAVLEARKASASSAAGALRGRRRCGQKFNFIRRSFGWVTPTFAEPWLRLLQRGSRMRLWLHAKLPPPPLRRQTLWDPGNATPWLETPGNSGKLQIFLNKHTKMTTTTKTTTTTTTAAYLLGPGG